MSPITTKEELKQVRDRVNPQKDVIHEVINARACDEYTCTETKKKRNALDFDSELARIEKEFAEL